MVDYYCHVLPHLLLCMQTSLECLDPASESMCFYLPESFGPAYTFHIDASIRRPSVGPFCSSEILQSIFLGSESTASVLHVLNFII